MQSITLGGTVGENATRRLDFSAPDTLLADTLLKIDQTEFYLILKEDETLLQLEVWRGKNSHGGSSKGASQGVRLGSFRVYTNYLSLQYHTRQNSLGRPDMECIVLTNKFSFVIPLMQISVKKDGARRFPVVLQSHEKNHMGTGIISKNIPVVAKDNEAPFILPFKIDRTVALQIQASKNAQAARFKSQSDILAARAVALESSSVQQPAAEEIREIKTAERAHITEMKQEIAAMKVKLTEADGAANRLDSTRAKFISTEQDTDMALQSLAKNIVSTFEPVVERAMAYARYADENKFGGDVINAMVETWTTASTELAGRMVFVQSGNVADLRRKERMIESWAGAAGIPSGTCWGPSSTTEIGEQMSCFLKLMLGAWLFAHHEDSKIATHMLVHFTYKVAEKSQVYHDATNMAQFGDVQITNDTRTGQVFIHQAAKDATHQSGDVIKGRNKTILDKVAAFIQGYIGHHGELAKCDAECQQFQGVFQASQTNRMMMNSHINQVAIARDRVVNMHKAIERKQVELRANEQGLEVSEL